MAQSSLSPELHQKRSPGFFEAIEPKIREHGKQLFQLVKDQKPSLFDTQQWVGRISNWAMEKPEFRLRLLRFVDVFPSIQSPSQLQRLVQEYFLEGEDEVPPFFKLGVRTSSLLGDVGGALLSGVIRKNLEIMAHQFIVGADIPAALQKTRQLRSQEYGVVLDLLGESTVSETECEQHLQTYLELLDSLKRADLPAIRGKEDLDWNTQPVGQISVKPSALYSKVNPMDFEGSVEGILRRLEPIAAKAVETNAAVCLDMESYQLKDITLEVFRRLRSHPDFAGHRHFGVVLQAYLRETEGDLRQLLDWMQERNLPSSIRLVKGAYWDYETILAAQNGWPHRVWDFKPQSDANFENCARILLEHHDVCYFACGSHNIRSIASVIAAAEELAVPKDRFEFQVLYGMAEPVRQALHQHTGRIRLYAPFGELIPGMAYLVRRILENTANESFLRHTFGDRMDTDALLESPFEQLRKSPPLKPETDPEAEMDGFSNQPTTDFTKRESRKRIWRYITDVRAELGGTRPLFIGGKDVTTGETDTSVNPNHPADVLGHFHLAGEPEALEAIEAAGKAAAKWGALSLTERAVFLRKAAQICKRRHAELAAWQILEVGKQWHEATGDVDEAIDFLNYYASQAEQIDARNPLGQYPGESNQLVYEPRGICTVIAPWNFPLAISMGMVSAAIVTGNPVIYKPSSLSALVGYHLVEIFREAGLPDGIFNYLPGSGTGLGRFLVEHKDIATIAFTGSMQVGLDIIQRAAVVQAGQRHAKRVIAEMGGKNAIIIDDDADLDEAVPAVLASAFGFQGQKCSACSRVVVLEKVRERFRERLIEAARSWKLGPSEQAGNHMGAVVDRKALEKVREYAALAAEEGEIVFSSQVPEGDGYFAPMTIVDGIRPEHRLAQEEVFGPVLAIMPAKDFSHALEIANSTRFALTGGLFSRTPSHLDRARREFAVGNLYLNRSITGALVGRQAFGGAAMSGVGSKAGGPDYLLQFLNPKVTTENTMRRGFAPESQ